MLVVYDAPMTRPLLLMKLGNVPPPPRCGSCVITPSLQRNPVELLIMPTT